MDGDINARAAAPKTDSTHVRRGRDQIHGDGTAQVRLRAEGLQRFARNLSGSKDFTLPVSNKQVKERGRTVSPDAEDDIIGAGSVGCTAARRGCTARKRHS